jgi:hypothetical protein
VAQGEGGVRTQDGRIDPASIRTLERPRLASPRLASPRLSSGGRCAQIWRFLGCRHSFKLIRQLRERGRKAERKARQAGREEETSGRGVR